MVVILIALLILLILIGMPLGFALLSVGSLGIYCLQGYPTLVGILSKAAYSSVNSFTFSSIPLFILMAHFVSKSKIADDLFESVLRWMGHIPGGVGVATIFASGGFGALSGSSIAANSVMSEIAVPQLIDAGYPKKLATGLVASSTGTLAVLIPPSVPLILYGIQTENSIGHLLIAGIFPGLLLSFLLCIVVVLLGVKYKIKTPKYSWGERFRSLNRIWPILLLILFVLFCIYFGLTTPTEASAFGAFGALLFGFALKRLHITEIIEALVATTKQTSMIFIIVVGARIFAYFITFTRVGNDILNFINQGGFSPGIVLFFVVVIYLIIGMFLELIGAMLLTLPLIYPLMVGIGYDPIWFGVVLVLLLEIGLVTPPVGINLFVTSQHSGVPVDTVFLGSIPFIFVLLLTCIILIAFPQIITFLPSHM